MIKWIVIFRNYLVFKWFQILAYLSRKELGVNLQSNFVVSIASYPKRDFLLPAVFQALSKQTIFPLKWILVLSKEDYTMGLPKYLLKLVSRGVEIIWTVNNPYAVKKLIPVIQKYPNYAIITLDDDIIYHKRLIEGLVSCEQKHPGSIVGYIGKAMVKNGSELNMFYREELSANVNTPSEQIYFIGWGGVIYPPASLSEKLFNIEAIKTIVPGRGSDLWFWAAAHAQNSNQICIGEIGKYNVGIPIPENKQTKTKELPNNNEMNVRFQNVIDYFCIREKLLKELPNRV